MNSLLPSMVLRTLFLYQEKFNPSSSVILPASLLEAVIPLFIVEIILLHKDKIKPAVDKGIMKLDITVFIRLV